MQSNVDPSLIPCASHDLPYQRPHLLTRLCDISHLLKACRKASLVRDPGLRLTGYDPAFSTLFFDTEKLGAPWLGVRPVLPLLGTKTPPDGSLAALFVYSYIRHKAPAAHFLRVFQRLGCISSSSASSDTLFRSFISSGKELSLVLFDITLLVLPTLSSLPLTEL